MPMPDAAQPDTSMPISKTYLNVPFQEKDAAKALGARWDAAAKKWYAPAGIDLAVFKQWHTPAADSTSPSPPKTAADIAAGVFTQPKTAAFTAYDGQVPPWE